MNPVLLNPLRTATAPVARPPDALGLLHRLLPGYAPTPLRPLPELAQRWGVARVLAKAETARFGLPSFKVLGASWAVQQTLLARAGLPPDTPYDGTRTQELCRDSGLRTLVTATDGNHGRAVAWAARLFGLSAEVLVPAGTAPTRIAAIAAEGADVRVTRGDYDLACREAAELADERSTALLVQDTWLPGHDAVPEHIVAGYGTLFAEVDAVLPPASASAVLVPVGVGSLALAAVRHYATAPTALVAVEPVDAGCLHRSLRGGGLRSVPGPYATAMAGLNCGTPSRAAWPELSARLDASALVDDAAALQGMRDLAAGGLAAGATGAACVAGGELLMADSEACQELRLDATSTVLLLVTEGVTDADHYRAVVGG